MKISDIEDCSHLCKQQNQNGCCSLDNKDGCYWKDGAFTDEINNSTATQCSLKTGANGMFVNSDIS